MYSIVKLKVKSSLLQGCRTLHGVDQFRVWFRWHQYFWCPSQVRKNVSYKYSNDFITATAGKLCSCVQTPTWAQGGHPGFPRSLMKTSPNHNILWPKGQDYCPPCLDSSLLLQGSRAFHWLFWYQCTLPLKFALFYCIYMTTLSPGCCLANLFNVPYLTIDDLINHYLFHLSLLVTFLHFFFFLGTTLWAKLFNPSWYFWVAEVANLQKNVVCMYSQACLNPFLASPFQNRESTFGKFTL